MQQTEITFPDNVVEYDIQNPHIYEAFKEMTFKTIQRGFKNYSANGVFEVLRWHTGVSGNDEYKLNNDYRAFYARKFAKEFPEHKDFFRTRKSKFDLT